MGDHTIGEQRAMELVQHIATLPRSIEQWAMGLLAYAATLLGSSKQWNCFYMPRQCSSG